MSSASRPPTPVYEPLGWFKSVLSIFFVVVGVFYLVWRYGTLGPQLPVFSWALYLAEIYGLAAAILHIFMCWRLTVREAPAPVPGITVDVFVPTYNEPTELVRRTLLAARNMDYRHETWLLDDGNRPEMKTLAERLGVRYLARTDNKHAKAGNLNNALAHSSGEMIAIFDADHAPQKRFLTRTLGYFADQRVAFVQTPQDFFNLDSYQHRLKASGKKLWTEQSLFFKIIQRGKDYWNAAFFCGSCAVVRRSALLEVGGFATETVTEDLHTSLRLHKAGYRSIYHAESLAFGIAPGNVAPFLKQRVRWGQGAMQVLKKENIFFTSKLTVAQRLNYLASIMTYFDGWQKGLFYFAPAFVLLTGILPIAADGWVFLCWFIPYYLLSAWIFEEIARGYGGTIYIEQYNFARFAAFAWATLGLFRNNLKFVVTDKSLSRESAMRRMFLPQIVVMIFNSAAIPFALVMALATDHHLPHDALVFNVVWAGVNLALGLAIFGFTRKTEKFIRAEYRFPVPLPMLAQGGGEPVPMTIDNVSSSGCRIYGRLPEEVRKGSLIVGTVLLPSGHLNIKAEVMSEIRGGAADASYLKAVGCRFLWSEPEDQDALELFLYGSDLQWHLLDIEEQSMTPSTWMRHRVRNGKSVRSAQDRWAVCEVIQFGAAETTSLHGLIPLPGDGGVANKLILYSALDEGALLVIGIHTRTGKKLMVAETGAMQVIENSLGPVYVLPLAPATIPEAHGQKLEAQAQTLIQEKPCEILAPQSV